MVRGRLLAGGVVLLVAVVITIAGCRADPGPAQPPATPAGGDPATIAPAPATPTPTVAPVVGGSAGCGQPLPADLRPGETVGRTLESAGRTRTYLVYVPSAAASPTPLPVVFNFHGLGSTGAQQHLYGGWVPIAEREGFVVISPDGVNNSWLLAAGLDDIRFVRDLVAALADELCLDQDRVYASGMSNGGFMSTTLACRANDLIAGIAPVAGQSAPGAACGPRPVPVISFHGTDDAVVPYAGGTITAGAFTGGPFAGVPPIVEAWAKQNGCDATPVETRVATDVTRVEFAGCGAPVVHYRVEGGGHTWPGGPAVPRLGPTTTSISASEIIWEFFEANGG
jgi:polyhydroxybutyrate depolymerase